MIYKSALMTQASGSMGGITASHNRGGQYFRARVIPVNPGTEWQAAVRIAMAELSNSWLEKLTAVQRDAWDTYAENVPVVNRLGEPISLTGFNHFLRSNIARNQGGGTFLDDAPTTFNLGTFTAPTLTVTELTQATTLTFDNTDAWANENDSHMLAYVSRPQGLTIHYFKGPYRYSGKIDGDAITPPTSPAPLATLFPFSVGQKLFAFVRVTRADGRYSALHRFEALVT